MKISRTLFFLLLFCFAASANALVLRGRVSAVPDGRTVVVISNGQKLTVLLQGVAAPELKQEFGDVSRQYLASLILDKAVEIDLGELKAAQVMGKVIYDQLDIGLQVIRDGAAWYDRNDHSLTETERIVYAASEQAARGERRGLWQDGSPMPPWEWRRAEAAKFAPTVATKRARKRGLQSEDLLFTGRRPNATAGAKGGGPLPKPTQKPFNTPGQDMDFSAYLAQGRVSVVYFYADWCPACREMTPVMEQINAGASDTQVVFMNIADWNTPVARQHGVTFVPYLKIYDKSGNLVAEGKNARAWLQQGRR
jgi:endonuclease YncB( thermonuclease family)/thiol-disulfide isomerase/thioredoxin